MKQAARSTEAKEAMIIGGTTAELKRSIANPAPILTTRNATDPQIRIAANSTPNRRTPDKAMESASGTCGDHAAESRQERTKSAANERSAAK